MARNHTLRPANELHPTLDPSRPPPTRPLKERPRTRIRPVVVVVVVDAVALCCRSFVRAPAITGRVRADSGGGPID